MKTPSLIKDPYNSFLPPLMKTIKTLLQFSIGLFLIIILTMVGIFELGETFQLVSLKDASPLLKHFSNINVFAFTAAALGLSAGVELGYMLFTDGPDEAISPLMLSIASAAFYSISKNSENNWVLGVYAISLLILMYCMKKYKEWGLDKDQSDQETQNNTEQSC